MADIFDGIEQRTERCKVCEDATATLGYENQTFQFGPGADGVILNARVPVWTCAGCGEEYLDGDAETIKHAAVCAHLGRLTPEEIKGMRLAFGMLQEAFANFTGYGVASIKRWESGGQIQSESVDKHLRLVRSLGVAEVSKRTSLPQAREFRTQISASARSYAQRFHLRTSEYEPDALAA